MPLAALILFLVAIACMVFGISQALLSGLAGWPRNETQNRTLETISTVLYPTDYVLFGAALVVGGLTESDALLPVVIGTIIIIGGLRKGHDMVRKGHLAAIWRKTPEPEGSPQ